MERASRRQDAGSRLAPRSSTAAAEAGAVFDTIEPHVFDLLPDALVVADADDVVVLVNVAAERLLGVSREKALGATLADAVPLRDDRGSEWWACSGRAVRLPGATRQTERSLHLVADGLRQGLTECEVMVTARLDHHDDGRLRRRFVALRDTAARERGERGRADLVSTVSHELRSPLTSVKGFTATLLAKWDKFTDDQRKVMLQTVNADADRVTRLITELLDVSRIDAGRLEVRRQIVDLRAAVQKVLDGCVASGEPPDRFVVRTEGTPPDMWLDPDKVAQILGNLVENALRHGAGTITVSVVARDDGAELAVGDAGEGVSDDVASRVFTKFWRGQPRRGGTGLGLYIVKGLVEAHGGTIELRRSHAGGAEFRFRLPAGRPPYEV